MKITLDIPKYTSCAFFNYVYFDGDHMSLGVKSLDTDDLTDGNEVKVEPKGYGEVRGDNHDKP